MTFYQRLVILVSIVLFASCSVKPLKEESENKIPQDIENNLNSSGTSSNPASLSATKSKEAKSDQKDVLSYFYEIYPKGSGKPVDGLNFEEKDISNGYLRATGNMEGYFVFVLFKGDKADWIIEQGTGCGPDCEQTFRVYKFENGKLTSNTKFESLFPKKKVDAHVARLVKKLPKGPTNEDLQSWLRLPQSGKSIDILIVEQNPGHTSGKANVYKAGKLNWNGSGFDFAPMNPTKPSSLEISSVR